MVDARPVSEDAKKAGIIRSFTRIGRKYHIFLQDHSEVVVEER